MRRLLTELTHWCSSQLQIELGPIHTAVHTEIWVVPPRPGGTNCSRQLPPLRSIGLQHTEDHPDEHWGREAPMASRRQRREWRSEFRGLPSRQVQRSRVERVPGKDFSTPAPDPLGSPVGRAALTGGVYLNAPIGSPLVGLTSYQPSVMRMKYENSRSHEQGTLPEDSSRMIHRHKERLT
jgi:hypothetical protein